MLAYRAEGLCRNANHLTEEDLNRCAQNGEVLQSTALAFDTCRRLRFSLCGGGHTCRLRNAWTPPRARLSRKLPC